MKRRRRVTRRRTGYLSNAGPNSYIIQLGVLVVIIGAIVLAFVAGMRWR